MSSVFDTSTPLFTCSYVMGFFDWKRSVNFNDPRRITLLVIKYKVDHITISKKSLPV